MPKIAVPYEARRAAFQSVCRLTNGVQLPTELSHWSLGSGICDVVHLARILGRPAVEVFWEIANEAGLDVGVFGGPDPQVEPTEGPAP